MNERIIATYRIAAPQTDIRGRARSLATEQSVEMPLEAVREPHVLDEIVASVEAIRPMGEDFEVDIGIAPATTGYEASQLMNMIFGNCSMQPDVSLIDVAFPPGFCSHFTGPRFGIEGVRAATRVHGRALTCTVLKPQGGTLEYHTGLARTFTLAGIDVIKDDHGLANQAFLPFAHRVPAVQKAIDAANRESGGNTLYAPTFSGGPRALAEQARIAKDCGVKMALVAPMLIGLPTFVEMVREHFDVPVMVHPSFSGAPRMAPAFLLGKLFRLFGADMIIFPNHGGRFGYPRETCMAITDAARAPWESLRPAMLIPAAGMTVERVDSMVADYGHDILMLIGGGLLMAGDKLLDRGREFVARVGACAA